MQPKFGITKTVDWRAFFVIFPAEIEGCHKGRLTL